MTSPSPRILCVTITAAGASAAARLPYETQHGDVVATLRRRWEDVDAFVVFASAGIAVRGVASLLASKHTDPAVLCVDEAGRWVVPLCGGHGAGANALAREVAELLGAQAVVTTATDAVGLSGLDELSDARAEGDVAAVTRALVDGDAVGLVNEAGWPLPPSLAQRLSAVQGPLKPPFVVVTDGRSVASRGTVVVRPRSLVVGVGASTGAPAAEMIDLAEQALVDADLHPDCVATVATLDRKALDAAVVALAAHWAVPVRAFDAATLAGTAVPNPSDVVLAAVGTPSVCEAAALSAAGPGAELVVAKRSDRTTTVAVARRRRPGGHLCVVGVGPGEARHRTPAATAAVRSAQCVVGYGPYVDLIAAVITPGAEIVRSPIGDEIGRVTEALGRAAAGERVSLVCSGDAGVYALATLVFELAPQFPALDPVGDIEVVPGVTAALTSAAALGAPLGHDHAAISLSDLLTPWEVIEGRLQAAAEADLVVSLYNPRSAGRAWQLGRAIQIFAAHRPPTTPVGVVTDAGRPGQRLSIVTLAEFDPEEVGMTTCVVVGASSTRRIGGRMVTPRGYRP